MPFVVGLDIGTRCLTGAVIAGTSSKFRLIDFFVEEIPAMGSQPQAEGGEYVPPMGVEELIQKVLAEKGLKAADIVASVESKDCVIRHFQVPFIRDEQIRKVIAFSAEEYFPALSMDEVVLEYMKVGEANGKSQLIVAALRNEVIQSRLDMLKRAAVDPVALDLDCAALFNAFATSSVFDPQRSTLLLDMGATSTKIVLVQGGEIKKIRSFRTGMAVASPDRMLAQPAAVGSGATRRGGDPGAGGSDSASMLEGSIEDRFQEIEQALDRLFPSSEDGGLLGEEPVAIVTDDEFVRIWDESAGRVETDEKRDKGAGLGSRQGASRAQGEQYAGEGPSARASPESDAAASEASGPSFKEQLSRIAAEIQRTFASSSASFDLLVLTGGMSGSDETCEYFASELGVETVRLELGTGSLLLDVPEDRKTLVSRQGAVAVGLALKEFGKDLVGIDFRKGRFRYEHRFSRLKFPLLLLSILGFLFFLETAYWAYYEHQRLSLLEMHLEADVRAVYKTFFEKELGEGVDPLTAATSQKVLWKKGGIGGVDKVVPAVDAIRNFGEVMKSTGLFFKITSMKFEFVVRPRTGSDRKTSLQPVSDSQVELIASDNSALVTLEKQFNNPAVSRFFTIPTPSSSTTKDGVKVTMILKFRPSVLQQIQ